ncbi:CBF1 [Sanghuangporus sanghuang]
MSTASAQPQPTVTSAAPVPPASVSATVASALQAIKEAGVSAAGSANNPTLQQDPQLMSALLSLIQSQAQKEPADQVKEAAAETLSNLSQAGAPQPNPNIHPQLQDSGPSTHPHGPPTLGQGPPTMPPPVQQAPPLPHPEPKAARRRAGPPTVNGTIMGSEEWARQRKDNHKEVERRRRGNINEGINELARIVPNGSGEKAKGAILSRSVQYIHHLKENEARNIEKWTLEKLLMDQAMGDLQAQLEDMRRMYQEESHRREKAEAEVTTLKAELEAARGSKSTEPGTEKDAEDGERGTKRPRTDA